MGIFFKIYLYLHINSFTITRRIAKMKFKLKNGMEVDLHDDDIKTIMNTYKSWQDEDEDEYLILFYSQ